MLEKITWNLGSPPPMRGKVTNSIENIFDCRITPAYAGKRIIVFVDTVYQRDHPRLCGEKVFDFATGARIAGSPPPMRGKVYDWDIKTLADGITPAYAGKSVNIFWA